MRFVERVCPNCGASVPDGNSFCEECGAHIQEKKEINIRNYMMQGIVFVALYLFFAITLPYFTHASILRGILRKTCILAIASAGTCFVIGAGLIDLSVGSVAGLSFVLTTIALDQQSVEFAITIGFAVGLTAGLLNGVVIAYLKIPALLATLGMQMICLGTSRMVTIQNVGYIENPFFFNVFGSRYCGGIVWMFVICTLCWFVLSKTAFGRNVLEVGKDADAAKYSGINITSVQISVMIISGIFAALAGMLLRGNVDGYSYSMSETLGTCAIAAVFIGGTRISGGKTSIPGAVFGSLLIEMIKTALVLYGLNQQVQMIFSGLVIILAVAIAIKRESLDQRGR